jgi:hypothetical protein
VSLRPSRLHDFGGIFTLSNGLRMEEILCSIQKVKQAKTIVDCAVRTVCTNTDVACSYVRHVVGPYRRHVTTPGSDMWQVDLDVWRYSWTNPEVTRVTTKRVTRGTGDVSS